MKNRFRLLAVVLAFGSVAAACSSETTRADLIEELTTGSNALTEEQANCVADGVEEAGIDYGLTEDDATAEDIETLTSITFDCVLGG